MLGGGLLGLIVGSIAVHYINQAMCPHSILGPCRNLSGSGTGLVILGGAVIGGLIGRAIGNGRL